jgi:hypothetical protein
VKGNVYHYILKEGKFVKNTSYEAICKVIRWNKEESDKLYLLTEANNIIVVLDLYKQDKQKPVYKSENSVINDFVISYRDNNKTMITSTKSSLYYYDLDK